MTTTAFGADWARKMTASKVAAVLGLITPQPLTRANNETVYIL